MKKLVLFIVMFMSFIIYAQNGVNKYVENLGSDTIKYFEHYIPTALLDTIGVTPNTSIFNSAPPYIHTYNPTYYTEMCAGFSVMPVYMLYEYILVNSSQGINPDDVIPKGYAQLMHTDTLLSIGGIAMIADIDYTYSYRVPFTTRTNKGDTIQILDKETLDVIYEKRLNDTLYFDTNFANNGFYNIIFDSAVQVQGDYLIAYKYNPNNIAHLYPNNSNSDVIYNIPLGMYYDASAPPEYNYSLYEKIEQIKISKNKNYKQQVYCYNYEQSWKSFFEYCGSYYLIEDSTFLPLSSIVCYSFFSDMSYDRDKVPHTTDLAVFVIPDYVVDSADRARARANISSYINDASLQDDFIVYPNPTEDILTIQVEGDVMIYNSLGQLVKEVKNIHGTRTIDISHLKQGVYLIKSGEHTEKLIKK
ncbi:MAG: T9SS type A sorting domain-containing protein [Bacteroidales bacterium]|nr:T9SS type A sorting domain-containing protein [Bacteroidales bacterium]